MARRQWLDAQREAVLVEHAHPRRHLDGLADRARAPQLGAHAHVAVRVEALDLLIVDIDDNTAPALILLEEARKASWNLPPVVIADDGMYDQLGEHMSRLGVALTRTVMRLSSPRGMEYAGAAILRSGACPVRQ